MVRSLCKGIVKNIIKILSLSSRTKRMLNALHCSLHARSWMAKFLSREAHSSKFTCRETPLRARCGRYFNWTSLCREKSSVADGVAY